jgi:hypothetical protein
MAARANPGRLINCRAPIRRSPRNSPMLSPGTATDSGGEGSFQLDGDGDGRSRFATILRTSAALVTCAVNVGRAVLARTSLTCRPGSCRQRPRRSGRRRGERAPQSHPRRQSAVAAPPEVSTRAAPRRMSVSRASPRIRRQVEGAMAGERQGARGVEHCGHGLRVDRSNRAAERRPQCRSPPASAPGTPGAAS